MAFTRTARIVSGLLVALLVAGCYGPIGDLVELDDADELHPFPTRETSEGPHRHEVRGIDIAKWQGDIEWEKVKASGVDFAFIKATEGADRADERFRANWEAAKAAGMPRGAYHFNYWCSPWELQADFYIRTVPFDIDAMPPVLDLEWNNASKSCPRGVDRDTALRGIRTFVEAVERHYGKRPILYADIKFYNDNLRHGAFANYPLWVRSVKASPQARYPGRPWAFWQHSEKGKVPGIRWKTDLNVFAGSRAQWRTLVDNAFQSDARERDIVSSIL